MSPWTDKEKQILIENYSKGSKEYICDLIPNKSWEQIKSKRARSYSNLFLVNNDLEKLFTNTTESYYWIGFLLADGSFSKTGLRFEIKEREQLERFKNFLGINNEIKEHRENHYIYVGGSTNVTRLKNQFGLRQNKTYIAPEPSIIEGIDLRLLLALIIGFIDGDGHIRRVKSGKCCFQITFENHASWKEIYEIFEKKISEFSSHELKKSNIRINCRGYVCMSICRREIILKLKEFVIQEKLPVLERKWNLISLEEINEEIKNRKIIYDKPENAYFREYSKRKREERNHLVKCFTNHHECKIEKSNPT